MENKLEMPSRKDQLGSNEGESERLLDSEARSEDSQNQDASNSSILGLPWRVTCWVYSLGWWLFWSIWSMPFFRLVSVRRLCGSLWRKFYVFHHSPVKVHVVVSGPTLKPQQTFMKKLDMPLEECSLETCRINLVFCPVVTRMGTDMEAVVKNVPDDKPVILVLMHHSYTPDHVDDIPIALPRSNVVKVVQCVFHEASGLLECDLNQRAVREVRSELKNYC